MASRSDIQAGKAHIELYVKNSLLVKGLRAAQANLQGLGTKIAGIGAGLTALGSAIIAPIGAAIAHFVKFGSELNDISARTGVSVGALGELKFAAEQTGAGLENIEAAAKHMKAAGLTETFDKAADRIAAIEDPIQRDAAALETFGKKAAYALNPMLANLAKLRQEARDAGLAPSEEAVGVADALGDAFDKVRAQALAAIFEIGAAIGPVLLPAVKIVSSIAGATIRWIKENQAVVRTVAAIGAGIVAAGLAVTAIGATVFGVGAAFGAAATVITSIAGVVSFLVSPIGLVVVGLVGAAVAWVRFTDSGKAALQAITDAVAPMLETLKTAAGGIGDALMAGNLQLAGQIAVKGLQLVFLQGLENIAGLISGTVGAAIMTLGTQLIQGDFAGAWETAVTAMATLWDGFVAGILASFADAVNQILAMWKTTVSTIQVALGVIGSALVARGGRAGQMASIAIGAAQSGLGTVGAIGSVALGAVSSAADATAAAKAGKSADNATAIAGSALAASDRVGQMEAELALLRAQAAEAKAAANRGVGATRPDFTEAEAGKSRVVVGTTAAGLIAQLGGGGDSPQKQAAATLRDIKSQNERQITLLEKIAGMKPAGVGA